MFRRRENIQALSLTSYASLGSNARLIVSNTCTAASKMYRLVSHKTQVNNFPKLVALSGFVEKTSIINVDFSTFCGFQALCFGVQTGAGRAIPVWNNCITYPIEFVGSQNQFVLAELKRFGKCLGFYPRFVFDRGFWITILLWFVTLAFWLAWWTNGRKLATTPLVHPKKKRSFFRIFWEELQRALRTDELSRLVATPG